MTAKDPPFVYPPARTTRCHMNASMFLVAVTYSTCARLRHIVADHDVQDGCPGHGLDSEHTLHATHLVLDPKVPT